MQLDYEGGWYGKRNGHCVGFRGYINAYIAIDCNDTLPFLCEVPNGK